MNRTDQHTDIKSLFGALAHDHSLPSDHLPDIEQIVAAILGKGHALNSEQLLAFEVLLDDPQASAEERQELLQAIWNVVVCFIDHKWKQAQQGTPQGANACGSNTSTSDLITEEMSDLIEWAQSEFEGENNETAAQKPRQKGSDDG